MQEHQKRVLHEEQELNDKLSKLSQFLTTDFFKSLSNEDRELLQKQEQAMAEYSYILSQRIALFK